MICRSPSSIRAIWAAILHFGSSLVGMPIGTAWLAGILVGMLPLQLLALSMAVMASG